MRRLPGTLGLECVVLASCEKYIHCSIGERWGRGVGGGGGGGNIGTCSCVRLGSCQGMLFNCVYFKVSLPFPSVIHIRGD